MNCNKAGNWIFLSDELNATQHEDLMVHLRSCPSCSGEWIFWQQVHQQLQQIRETQGKAPLSSDFEMRLQKQIHSQTILYRQNPQITWLRQQPFLPLAAAILFLASVLHTIPPLIDFSFPLNSKTMTSQLINWIPPILKKNTLKSPQTQGLVPYRNDSFQIHEELQRRKSQYFMKETSNQEWTQQIPYFSTPTIYSDKISTDF